MSTIYLKVKLKSLMAEARFIKREERKQLGRARFARAHEEPDQVAEGEALYRGLYRHRVRELRPEARETLLAYSFLRGRSYRSVVPYDEHEWKLDEARVLRMVERYGSLTTSATALSAWLKEPAREHPVKDERPNPFSPEDEEEWNVVLSNPQLTAAGRAALVELKLTGVPVKRSVH